MKEHFAKQQQPYWDRKLANAYGLAGYQEARQALRQVHRELINVNPSAARSLDEGFEETLTVHRLGVPEDLRRTLCTTNPIESALSRVRTVCRNVKRWRAGGQRERWIGSALIFCGAEIPSNCRIQEHSEVVAALQAYSADSKVAKKTA